MKPEDILNVTWADKCKAEADLYDAYVKKYKYISIRTYAKDVRQAPKTTVMRRIKLAGLMRTILPELENLSTLDQAWKHYRRLVREGWIKGDDDTV